jgi:ABC-type glycerol-3-phosphate transport system substrate-binding protein
MRVMKRSKLILSLSLLTVMIIAPLAVFAAGEAETKEGGAEVPFPGATITVAIDDRLQNQTMRDLAPGFTDATGIEVEFIEMPELTLFEKATLDLESGTGLYDVIQYDYMRLPKYGPEGKLQDLNQFISNTEITNSEWFAKENFPTKYLDGMTYDGELFGLPLFCHTNFLHYRKDLFDKYDVEVPTTIKELEEAAKALTMDTDNDGKLDQYGIALRGQRGESINMWVYPFFLRAYGGEWFDDNWNPTFNSPEGVAGLEKMAELIQNYAPPGAANYGWVEIQNGLLDGHIAMVIDVEFMGLLSEDPSISKVVGKMGHTYIPMSSGYSAYPDNTNPIALWAWAVTMNAASKNKEAAWQFIQWWTSDEVGEKCGYFSSKEAIRASYEAIPNPQSLQNTADIGLQMMANGNPNYKPRIPEWVEIGEDISVSVSEVLTNQTDAKAALDRSAKFAAEVLEKAGY